MSSNSSGPASPFNADEAEQLAAQFRPVWDVEEATPAPETAVEPPPVPAVPVAKATVRWAPGNGPEGFPAPAPPAPLPAPSPRKRREAPAPPEVRELTGDEKVPVSSDGAVAMAVVTGPVLPPKAADVAVPQEPSIVVKDIAATARAIADEEAARKRSDEDRRRQTVRLDDLRKDPGLAEMYAKYDAPAAAPAPVIEPAPAPPSRRAAVAAPIPEVEDEPPPANNNRKIVFGAVGVAALIAVLGIAKATLSDKDDPLPTPPGTTEAATRQTSTPGASLTGTTAPDSAAPREDTTATAAHADPPAKPTATTPAPSPADPPAAPARKDAPKKEDRPREEPKPKAATPPPPPPPPQQPPPPAADKKKPAGKGAGGIVRDAPF
jgi:hypothetical protein